MHTFTSGLHNKGTSQPELKVDGLLTTEAEVPGAIEELPADKLLLGDCGTV